MTNIFLVFLGAAYLNNLVLLKFFDGPAPESSQPFRKLALWVGLLIFLDAMLYLRSNDFQLPAIFGNYLHVLVFVLTSILVGASSATPAPGNILLPKRLRRTRRWLPLLVANSCVLAFVAVQQPQVTGLAHAAAFCLAASIIFYSIHRLFAPMRERIEHAPVAPAFGGVPIIAATCGIVSLALMGFAGALPW